MISLRSLTDHTLSSYCTYIKDYLHYLMDILHKSPEDVLWSELRNYIRWLQKSRTLSDRTIDTYFLSRHIYAHEKRLGTIGKDHMQSRFNLSEESVLFSCSEFDAFLKNLLQ